MSSAGICWGEDSPRWPPPTALTPRTAGALQEHPVRGPVQLHLQVLWLLPQGRQEWNFPGRCPLQPLADLQ